jgi:uncharacterized protein (TIGR02246 family)
MCNSASDRSRRTACCWQPAAVLMALTLAAGASGDERDSVRNPSEAAIRATADSFVQAFNRGDAKSVAALWTANGSVVDDRGQLFKGRKAIEDEYAAMFKAYPGAKMEVAVKSIEFPTPTMAVEDGTARVVVERAGPPVASRYTAVHVKDGGKWLMSSVRETSIPLSSGSSRLEELAWLIGSWKTKGEGAAVHTTFRWIAHKNFMQRDYTVRQSGVAMSSGTQIIGWDVQAGQIRSWSFDSSGGIGTSLWSASPEGWFIESTGMLSDGTPTSSRELLIRVAGENDVFGWRSFDRKAGRTILPDLREVVLDRVSDRR